MPAPERHPDAVDLLRLGLWGETDAATLSAARHGGTCDACRSELAELRRIRDLVRTLRGTEPSAGASAAIAKLLDEHAVHVLPPGSSGSPRFRFGRGGDAGGATSSADLDAAWLRATAIGSVGGVRAARPADRVMRCEDGDLALAVAMHALGEPGRWDLTGQVLLDGTEPGADLVVTLFLDRLPSGAVRTDGFGEFSLTARGARHVGVRVAGHGRPRHVELWRADPAPHAKDRP